MMLHEDLGVISWVDFSVPYDPLIIQIIGKSLDASIYGSRISPFRQTEFLYPIPL